MNKYELAVVIKPNLDEENLSKNSAEQLKRLMIGENADLPMKFKK